MESSIKLKTTSQRWLDLIFISITLLVCLVATLPQIQYGDYKSHIRFATEMAADKSAPLAHALYQKLILVLRTLIPFRVLPYQSDFLHYVYNHSFTLCAIAVALAAYLATAVILKNRFYKSWKNAFGSKTYGYAWMAAFGMLLINPIILFTIGTNRLTLGYLPANVWHNPTYILMRPFALWLFFFIQDHWDQRLDRKQWLLVALVSYLVIFAKPNFTLSMLPAIGLLTLVKSGNIKKRNWSLLSAFILPSLLSLAYQYWLMSSLYPEVSSYIFAPFLAALYYTGNAFTLIAFLLLSIAFPLLITLLNHKLTLNRVDFQLAWLNFFVALLTFLLFAEIPYVSMLNFSWGSMMAVFLLFTVSLNYLVQEIQHLAVRSWQLKLLSLLLSLHFISGIIYTIMIIIQPSPIR